METTAGNPPKANQSLHLFGKVWIFVRYFVPKAVVIFGFFAGLCLANYELAEEEIKVKEQAGIELLKEAVQQDFKVIVADLAYLGRMAADTLGDASADIQRDGVFAGNLVRFAEAKELYSHLDLYDSSGGLELHTNFQKVKTTTFINGADGVSVDRPYLRRAWSADKGEVVVSPLYGRSDKSPGAAGAVAIYFAMPIFDKSGRKRGIIVLEYDAAELFRRLHRMEQRLVSRVTLTNSRGDTLYRTTSDGVSIEGRKPIVNLREQTPDLWWKISLEDSGQFEIGSTLSTYSIIRPLKYVDTYAKKVGLTLLNGGNRHDVASYGWRLLAQTDVSASKLVRFLIDPKSITLALMILAGAAWSSLLFAKSEHRRRLSETALRVKQAELVEALARQEEVNKLQKNFISTVSHEFRSPLAIIDTAVQILVRLRVGESDGVSERLASIRSSVKRINTLIDRVLSAARIDGSHLTLNLGHHNINKLIHDVALEQMEISSNRVVNCQFTEPVLSVEMDSQLIRQVVANLITNAVKYSPSDTPVVVYGAWEGRHYHMAVHDSGVGIPENEIDMVFDRFYRASTAKGVPGTGLGLELVKSIVTKHNGRITVESRVGKGSTFHVYLPRIQPGSAHKSAA